MPTVGIAQAPRAHWLRRFACRLAMRSAPAIPFSRDVAEHQPEPVATETEEIVVIATHLASLDACAPVFECSDRRQLLGKEPGLYLLGDFEFLGSLRRSPAARRSSRPRP